MLYRALIGIVILQVVLSSGCANPSAKVSGRVTCNDKGVIGSILFSPMGEGTANTGAAVTAPLNDGHYQLELPTVGKHRIVVSPSDVVYPAEPGQEYPCDLTPVIREVKAGMNDIPIQLSSRNR